MLLILYMSQLDGRVISMFQDSSRGMKPLLGFSNMTRSNICHSFTQLMEQVSPSLPLRLIKLLCFNICTRPFSKTSFRAVRWLNRPGCEQWQHPELEPGCKLPPHPHEICCSPTLHFQMLSVCDWGFRSFKETRDARIVAKHLILVVIM